MMMKMITCGKYKERVNINLMYRNESLSFLFPTVNVSVEAGSESYSKHFLLNPPTPTPAEFVNSKSRSLFIS